ncbi:MAG: prepilin-type N-terminal cleavage/methylation domain-containing protein [bacterium]
MTGSKGITLIELLVGMACFSIVVVLVTGIFVTALGAKKQVKELSVLQDEARYIMDYMAREIRVAKINEIGGGGKILKLNDDAIMYKFQSDQIQRQAGAGLDSLSSNLVKVSGDFSGNINPNGLVTINMTLQSVKNPSLQLPIQTTISSRIYE